MQMALDLDSVGIAAMLSACESHGETQKAMQKALSMKAQNWTLALELLFLQRRVAVLLLTSMDSWYLEPTSLSYSKSDPVLRAALVIPCQRLPRMGQAPEGTLRL
eukprot:Skav227023  [mRNA]  locus=scaffold456:212467:215405:+ [translate_table: standard]